MTRDDTLLTDAYRTLARDWPAHTRRPQPRAMTTTLSTYTDTDSTAHERAIRAIATALANDARGRENAISSADLAERTPVSASTVRDLVPEVMDRYCLPVGTASGYFIIDDREEYARQVDRQLRQAETSRERARLISSTFNRSDGGIE